jgi:pimeloyl-ACP methyl ester carboxylesterase
MTMMASIIQSALLLLHVVAGDYVSPPSVYPVDEHIFDAVVDHYSFRRHGEGPTFPLRYYVNEEHWNGTGPCFFYAGNEADIFQFVNNSGFMFEAAVEFGAMVVFAEHRYYGESVIGNFSYLTVEQAMADFNTLNVHIREHWRMAPDLAFIAFGGSYGANLAMWLRLKNPNLWAGAIASSATPLKHILRETNGFALIETDAYRNVSSVCPDLVRSGWAELYNGAATEEGRVSIGKELRLCHPLEDYGAANDIHGWVSGALETMVQYGYPYPTKFYEPVPAYPFRVACEGMLSAGTGLGALRAAAVLYYNYTGQAGSCFDFERLVVVEAAKHWQRKGDRNRIEYQQQRIQQRLKRGIRSQTSRLLLQNNKDPWGYQTCTEVYQPMPTDGTTDFEIPHTPNQAVYFNHCRSEFNVLPRPNWEEMHFMGANIAAGSNIFLTNGQLDPWRAAGIQEKPKGAPDSIIVRTIENGAHHLDLRAANPMDPPSVVKVRIEEKAAMRQWIQEWKEICPSTSTE